MAETALAADERLRESGDEVEHVCFHGDDDLCDANPTACTGLCGTDMSSDEIEWLDGEPDETCVVCLAMHARRMGWVPEGWVGP